MEKTKADVDTPMINKEVLNSTTQVIAQGFAGDSGPVRFRTGGGFYWSDGGSFSPSLNIGIASDLFSFL
ncbi:MULTISPECIES: hypothetical protein [unclassified Lactococcus]|nr:MULTISPECIES: hypothetical protein [unclassified Lactococcus]MQW22864.1 hypothetical protein [Lactococcus sp. dk101]TXK50442.1 hypothetical protein FVP43_04845 [Lactococcus sp. dk322]